MGIYLLVAREKICFGNSSRFILSVYDNNPQRNISAKTDLFQCTAICVGGGTQGSYSCDASQGNFLCIENLFPTHRKNISRAEKICFRCVAIRFCLATLSAGDECEILYLIYGQEFFLYFLYNKEL